MERPDKPALYDRLGGPLYRYAVMILADPSGAADAVQQVFVTCSAIAVPGSISRSVPAAGRAQRVL